MQDSRAVSWFYEVKPASSRLHPKDMEDIVLKAIIVDDEAPARSELTYLLGEVGGVEVVAEAAGVREAIEKLKE